VNKIRALLGKFASDESAEAVYLLRRFPKDERSLALLSKLPKTERVEKEVEFLTRRCDRMREALSSLSREDRELLEARHWRGERDPFHASELRRAEERLCGALAEADSR
jgi:hypothetical protein